MKRRKLRRLPWDFAKQSIILLLFLAALQGFIAAPNTYGQSEKTDLPEKKQTTLGLYVTARKAYEMWKDNPDKVKILDVRTQEEYYYIGHPAMAWNIPLLFQSYEWDAEKKHFPTNPNPDFLKHTKEVFQLEDIILITCRSGGRSAMAVNKLAAAGYKNVYSITDGVEGDKVKDPESVFHGLRMKNGWKNSVPYTYTIDPKLMRLQEDY